jgi:hypothetical protein
VSERALLKYRAMIEEIVCERLAAEAMNRERQDQGFADAYGEEHFLGLAARLVQVRQALGD